MGVMERYNEKKKKKDTSNNETTKLGVQERYELNKLVGNKNYEVNEDFINSFISDANNFLSSAEEEYGKIGWSTASSTYDSRNSKWLDLYSKSAAVRRWLDNNKNNLDADSYKKLSESIDSVTNGVYSVTNSFKSAKDYYAQWDSEDAYNEYARQQKEREDLLNSEDFEHYSQIGASIKNPSPQEAEPDLTIFGWQIGEQIPGNIVTYSRDNAEALGLSEANGGGSQVGGRYIYSFLTDEETAVYNYYLGKGDKAKADEFLASMEDILQRRHAGKMVENVGDSKALQMTFAVAAGLDQFASGIKNIDNYIKGTEGDQVSSTQYASQMIRQDLDGFWGTAYDFVNTTSNMLPSVLVSYVPVVGQAAGLATMGTSAVGNAYAEMRSLGYDANQARGYATLVGASEVALQKLLGGISSLGGVSKHVAKFVNKFDNALARLALNYGINSVSEGLEEGIQTVIEPVFKAWATGEDFEAAEWDDILYSALLGSLSAGFIEGVPTSIGAAGIISSNIDAKKTYGSGGDVVTEAIDVGGEAKALGEKYQKRLDGGKELSGGQINRLLEEIDTAVRSNDTAKIKNAILKTLGEYGETTDVTPIADVLVKYATGEKLTSKDYSILNNSDKGHLVLSELNKANIQSGGLSNNWASNIGTKRISPDAYNKDFFERAKAFFEGRENAEKEAVAKTIADAENAKGEKFDSSDSGKIIYKDAQGNSREVSVNKVVSTKGGLKVELDDGNTVSAKDLTFGSHAEAIVYEMVTRMDVSPETATDFIKSFKPTNDKQAATLFSEVPLAYKYGTINYEAGLKNVKMPESEKRIAFNRGKADAIAKAKQNTKTAPKSAQTAKTENSDKTGKNGIIYEDGFTYDEASANEMQKVSMAHIEVIDQISNLEVHIYESKVVDGKRVAKVNGKTVSAPNGYFKDGNKIYVDFASGNNGEGAMLYTMSHEITHFIRKWNEKGFKELADFLIEQYGKKGVPVNSLIEAQKETIRKRYKDEKKTLPSEAKLFDMAYEELVADAMSDMLTDPKAYEKLMKLKQKNHSLWAKLGEAIKAILDKFKSALGIYKTKDVAVAQEAHEVRGFSADAYEKLQDLYLKAFVEADANYEASRNDGSTDLDGDENAHIFSERSMVEGAGLQFVLNEDGVNYKVLDKDGKPVKEVTKEMIVDSPLGNLVTMAKNEGFLGKGKEATLAADKQYEFLAELVNMCINYNGIAPIWETAGTMVFSSMKSNADKQYGLTIDFSTVCKKTQAIVDAMSEAMLRLGRGLTRSEVEAIYLEVGKAGESTPCPVCYVFSRWMGIGGILDQISRFQDKYTNMSEESLQAFIADIKKRIVERANTPGKNGKLKATFFNKKGEISEGKVIADLKSKASSKAASALNAIAKNSDTQLQIQELEALMENQDSKEAKKTAKKIESLKKKLTDVEALEKEMRDADDILEEYEAYQWLTRTLMTESNGEWVKNSAFKPVPKDILFDLNKGDKFAEGYPLSWAFRTGKGASAGKAIVPYADARVGEAIQTVASGSPKDIKIGLELNPFLNSDTKGRLKILKSAIEKQARQNLIGGQRYQSTSDFRYEYGSDYLITFLEMQAIGAKVQLYTKVIEAVDFLASVGADCNLSVMPLSDGFITLPDGTKKLVYSSVTGIDADAAIKKSREYNNVQLILVGISDEHIRLALEGTDVTFVIPFHGSGNSVHQIQALMNLLGENLDVTTAQDYTPVQSDHVSPNQTKEQKAMWDLRVKIIQGKASKITASEQALLDKNAFLKDLYRRFYIDKTADEYGVGLTAGQSEQIFPYEYWDKSLTYAEADRNGDRFKEYCASMGIIPRFSGKDSKGENVGFGDFSNNKGYWKLLIDRPMYDNTYDADGNWTGYGKYHEQARINCSNFNVKHLDPEYGSATYGDVMSKENDPKKTNKIVDAALKQFENNEVHDVRSEGETVFSERDSATVASDLVSHMRGIIQSKKSWKIEDLFDYVEKHKEVDFVERIFNKDKTVKSDLEAFLNDIDDPKLLHDFSWFIGEAYARKGLRYNDSYRLYSPYQGAVRTFRNAIKKRTTEVMSQVTGGKNLGVKNGDVSLDDIKTLFDRLNSDDEIGALAKKVFATAEKLGVNIRFANDVMSKNKKVGGDNLGDMVEYKTSYFNDAAYSDQRKAQTILHELIHACTVYVLEENPYMGDVGFSGLKSDNYERIANAATRLNRIYYEIKDDPDFQGMYGIKNAKEMVAELSNPKFVEALKKKSLWQQVLDFICDLFGFTRGNSAYDNAMMCLDYILDNPEISEYKKYSTEQRRNARRNGYNVFGQTMGTDGVVRFSDRDASNDYLTEYAVQAALYDSLDHADKGDDNLIRISNMPKYVVDLLGIDGDFYIYRNHAYENMVSEEQAKEDGRYDSNAHYHNLGIGTMTDAMMSLNNPIMTIATKSKEGNPTVIMLLPVFGQNTTPLYSVLSFYSNKPINGDLSRKPHVVLTIHERNFFEKGGRAGIADVVKSAIDDGRVLDFDKKRREDLSVIAKSAGLGNITENSLKESLAHFRKTVNTFREKNKINYSDRNNIGYHAGDLGKSEYYHMQGYSRGTGHFGTGTYFVGDESKISGNSGYGNRPHHAVDFSDYNLYKIKSDKDGYELHEQLRVIDGGISQEWIAAASQDRFRLFSMVEAYDIAREKYGDNQYSEEARIYALRELGKRYDIELLSREEYSKENDISLDDEDFDYYYVEYLTDTVKQTAEERNGQYEEFRDAYFSLQLRFGFGDKVLNAMKEVLEHQNANADTRWNADKKDSLATVFMKSLGYEGIDVRGTKLDNVEYGSVIYDLKEDTILYQDRNPNAVSNRTLLANALENLAQNDIEKNKLAQYKAKIALIESEQAKLNEIKEKANEIRFTKGRTPSETKTMRDLEFEANQIANRINTYDKQLLSLESTTALKNVLEREKKLLRKRLEQKGKDAIKAQKEKDAKTIRALMDRHTESRKKAIEGRHKTEMRDKIKKVVSDLNHMLLNPTKEQHVPIGLQLPVAEALDAINMDSMNAGERVAYYNDLIAKSNNPDEIAMLTKKRDFFEYRDANFKERITALKNAYAEFKESDDPLIRNAHNEAIEELIKNTADAVGNTSLKDMSLGQLEAVHNMYKAILATVKNSNKMFKEGRQATVTENSEAVKTEVREVGGHKDRVLKIAKFLKKFGWGMLKPVTAMKVVGSKTFESLFANVRAGEDTWAVDVNEAKTFYDEVASKYKYSKWDFKKRYSFKDSAGIDFSLSLEQIMSLYAYSKRDQADRHLEVGGFIFDDAIEVTEKKLGIPLKYEVNDANPYRLRKEDLASVVEALSPEQKAFVDEMQAYLSDVMGAKGNEVSLAMYDIKLYNEKYYFPLKTSRYFREFDPEKSGTPKIKNSGFSKKTVPQAGNPIVLANFMDVWATHVNDMSMYHAFVLPLEDFLRVYNYSSTAGGYDSVQQYIKNAYGAEANLYIERLMDDLNGGARVDSSAGIINKGLSLFKKASTFASASVVIQQPSAIARALAYINPKYFVASAPSALNLVKHKALWAEVKKYAPVAIIKEMGYFDTGVGRSTVEWIKGNNSLKEKVDDVLSKAPAIADELCWTHIWEAVKKETQATTNLKEGSEEFLKKCGERFTEVITNTQVYDSVLSRSGMMRSKDTGVKMMTAFMAEPTTTVNMMVDGIIQGKRGNKKFTASTIGAVASSVILNSLLVSLVYAARDDDEDETYAEKYAASLTSELLDGFNPITYFPFFKDAWSIAQGFDVERADMTLVTNLIDSLQQVVKVLAKDTEDMDEKELEEYRKEVNEAVLSIIDNATSLIGVPVKNIRRDINAIINTAKTIGRGDQTTAGSLKDAVGEAAQNSIPVLGWLPDEKKTDKLYEAIVGGDKVYAERIKKSYKSEEAYESAVRKALKDNDPRIHEAAQARYEGDISTYTRIAKEIIAEGNFSQDTVVGAINAEMSAIKKGESTGTKPTEDKDEATSIYNGSDVNAAFDNGDTSTALEIIDDLVNTKVANGKTEQEAKSSVRSSMTSYWKPLYKEAYQSGDTSEMARIRQILFSSGLYGTANEVVKTVQNWLKD